VVALAAIGDVDDLVGVEGLESVKGGGEVGAGVVAGAVGLADDERLFLEARVFGMEDDLSAFAEGGDARFAEFFVNAVDLVAVKAFPKFVVELDAEAVVEALKCVGAYGVDGFPDADVFRVTRLQFDEFGAGFSEGFLAFLGFSGAPFVKLLEFVEGVFAGIVEVVSLALDSHDEHAETGAPVADMVIAGDGGAGESEHAADGFTDDEGAEVTDVQLFGGIGRAVVHDNFLTLVQLGRGLGDLLGAAVGGNPLEEECGLEGEIDEAGACDGNLDEFKVELRAFLESGYEFLAECAWVGTLAFGVGEDAIGLVISKPGIRSADIRGEAILETFDILGEFQD